MGKIYSIAICNADGTEITIPVKDGSIECGPEAEVAPAFDKLPTLVGFEIQIELKMSSLAWLFFSTPTNNPHLS